MLEENEKKYKTIESFTELFISCPVIKILREDNEISIGVYKALQNVLVQMKTFADSRESIEITRDVT